MNGLAGAVVWAVVPYAPAAPFRLYAGREHDPIELPTVDRLVAAARKGGDQQFTYLVPGKVRPVLILSDAHDEDLGEVLALRLARFAKLTPDEQQRVRDQRHPTLFHLRPQDFPGLPGENAAMVAGLVRLHRSAIDGQILGRLGEGEPAVVHERLARFHGLNLRGLVDERLRQLAAAQEGRRLR